MDPTPPPASRPPVPSAMADAVRALDWSTTPLGPMADWPPALRIASDMMLSSRFPACLIWGPALTMIYNDDFAPTLGAKPAPLGRDYRDVWAEAWPVLGPIVERARAGVASFVEDFPLAVLRYGRSEAAAFTFSYSPVRDEHGTVVGVLEVVLETTNRLRAERQWREAHQHLERQVAERTADRNRMWNLSIDIMAALRHDGTITAVNPAWTATLGWPEHEIVGRNLGDIVHAEDAAALREGLAQGDTQPATRRFECRCRDKSGGYRTISWTAVPGGGFLNAVGRDITTEQAQARAMRLAEDDLRQSQKMDAVGQLTGGLAHDFNNLLAGISGSLELLDMRLKQGRTQGLNRYIDAAQAGARRAAALTHRLLAFSRRQTLDPKPTAFDTLVGDMADLIRRTVGPSISLKFISSADVWPVRLDPQQLENTLLNLCLNARDAMPEGGCLTIETSNLVLDRATAAARQLPAGELVVLRVTDTGSGMTPDILPRIFDPFFTTKPTGQGTGLGLSMVYGFVRQSGGAVRAESAPGKGATLRLYFPRHHGPATPAAAPRPQEANGAAARGRGETVLLVDDEPAVRMLVAEALEEAGYTVIQAANGLAAMAVVESDTALNMLVTDVGLPEGLNGRQVADAARAMRPGLRVLFITGYAEKVVFGGDGLDHDMQILTKPFAMDDLAARVKAMMPRQPPRSIHA